jgi:hypothetical protein
MKMSRVRQISLSVSIASAAALALIAFGESRPEHACASSHPALIPAYLKPSGLAPLIAHPDRNRLVVVNPENGPGTTVHPAYADAIAQLQGTGTGVLGYVRTDYGSRDPALVRRDVERYSDWYGIRDLFVDEVAAGADELPYYTTLSANLRTTPGRLIAFNPGRTPAPGYFGLADIVVTFEGSFADYRATRDLPPTTMPLSPTKTAHLIFGASDQQARDVVAHPRADYVYASPATYPNPWGTLAPSLTAQQARLAPC